MEHLNHKPNITVKSNDTLSYNAANVASLMSRLPSVLQTTLDLEDLISLFHDEVIEVLPYDSLHFHYDSLQFDINEKQQFSCDFHLDIGPFSLGEITISRRSQFSREDINFMQDLLNGLVYPLRNCLLYQQSQAAALQDRLTGLNNRTAFDKSLEREIDLANRQNIPLSMVIIDIDNFKDINDTLGHSVGDRVLQALSSAISSTVRRSDIAFRYAGDEFALLLNNTDTESAHLLAERLRLKVASLNVGDGHNSVSFTISLGIAKLNKGEQSPSFFDRADQALYQAKNSGRNLTASAAVAAVK